MEKEKLEDFERYVKCQCGKPFIFSKIEWVPQTEMIKYNVRCTAGISHSRHREFNLDTFYAWAPVDIKNQFFNAFLEQKEKMDMDARIL